jgi:hypothetical protein
VSGTPSGRDHQRFQGLTYEDFRRRAADPALSPHERIGFPDEYRAGFDDRIVADIEARLPALTGRGRLVLDIGPGCGPVAAALIARCRERRHQLLLADSAEMLAQLPDEPFIHKKPGRYPAEATWLAEYRERVDAAIVYSVLHYIFAEGNVFDFLDRTLTLLAPGGRLLVGDVPNVSKRKRFFSSSAGIHHHQAFTGTGEIPSVSFNTPEPGQIDDSVVLSLLLRARAAGFDAYVLPQGDGLPMANRREDLLFCRP